MVERHPYPPVFGDILSGREQVARTSVFGNVEVIDVCP